MLPVSVFAATVVLEDGTFLTGELIETTPNQIILNVTGQELIIDRSQVIDLFYSVYVPLRFQLKQHNVNNTKNYAPFIENFKTHLLQETMNDSAHKNEDSILVESLISSPASTYTFEQPEQPWEVGFSFGIIQLGDIQKAIGLGVFGAYRFLSWFSLEANFQNVWRDESIIGFGVNTLFQIPFTKSYWTAYIGFGMHFFINKVKHEKYYPDFNYTETYYLRHFTFYFSIPISLIHINSQYYTADLGLIRFNITPFFRINVNIDWLRLGVRF
jgi:hypothetical protein